MDAAIIAETLLPFTLVFTIVYALLVKTEALGKRNTGGNVVIALAVALTLATMHLRGIFPEALDPVNWINIAVPYFSLTLIIILMLLLVLAVLGIEPNWRLLKTVFLFLVVVDVIIPDTLLIALFLGNMDGPPPWLAFLTEPVFIGSIIAIAIFLSLVWYVVRD